MRPSPAGDHGFAGAAHALPINGDHLPGRQYVHRLHPLQKAAQPEVWQINLVGILVGLGTGLAFACYSLAGKWSAKRFASPWTVTAFGFFFAALGLMLTQTPQTAFSLGLRWDGWLILAVLALVPTILGFGLYTLSLRYLQASMAGLIASLEPALTTLMAITLLRRPFENLQWFRHGAYSGGGGAGSIRNYRSLRNP